MPYRTGSGLYTDMMADVLAHAIADGWSTTGGNWPINKGGLYVDWTTVTAVESDLTLGGAGGTKTQRYLRIGLSWSSAAEATSRAAAMFNQCPNFAYTITSWHIFSDPTVSDHIMVCFEFSNGVDPQVFGHFGFGRLDQGGLSHGGVAFSGGQYGRGYAAGTGFGFGAGDWNSLGRTGHAYAGSVGEGDDAFSRLVTCINPTSHPIPAPGPGVGGWPNTNTHLEQGANVWTMSRISWDADNNPPGANTNGLVNFNNGANLALNWGATFTEPQPFSGSLSMLPLPIFFINGATLSSVMFYAGAIPNLRLCSMDGFAPGDEVQFAGDVWKVFPMLCAKAETTLNAQFVVTSGKAGFAYKKVT